MLNAFKSPERGNMEAGNTTADCTSDPSQLSRKAAVEGAKVAFLGSVAYSLVLALSSAFAEIGSEWMWRLESGTGSFLTYDEVLGYFFVALFIFLYSMVLGGIPATWLGLITGWSLSLFLMRLHPAPARTATIVGAGSALCVGLLIHLPLWLAGWVEPESLVAYMIALGVPTLLFLGLVVWRSRLFYQNLQQDGRSTWMQTQVSSGRLLASLGMWILTLLPWYSLILR
jgi:hypothetical protein